MRSKEKKERLRIRKEGLIKRYKGLEWLNYEKKILKIKIFLKGQIKTQKRGNLKACQKEKSKQFLNFFLNY